MNREWVLINLHDALTYIKFATDEVHERNDLFKINMANAYRSLNAAWNGRYLSSAEIESGAADLLSRFPTDLDIAE